MANPNYPVNVPMNSWELIAEGVTSGIIWNKGGTRCLQTYRLTGDPAPTDPNEGVEMFVESSKYSSINSRDSIDIYCYSPGCATILRVDV